MSSQIYFLDSTLRENEVRIIKSPVEILGFNIKNETGEPLFIEIKRMSGFLAPGDSDIEELIIRK
jgi:hypothetical protein